MLRNDLRGNGSAVHDGADETKEEGITVVTWITSKCGRFRSTRAAAVSRHEIYCHKCALKYAGR